MEEPTSEGEAAKGDPVEKEPPGEAPAAEERTTEEADPPAGAASSRSKKASPCCACCTPPGSCLLSSLFTCLVAAALYYQLHMEIKEANDLLSKSLRGAGAAAHGSGHEAGPLKGGPANSSSPATARGAPGNETVQPHSNATDPQRERPEEGTAREAGPHSTTGPQRKHPEEGAHERAGPQPTTGPQREDPEEGGHEEAGPHPTTGPQREDPEAGGPEKAGPHSIEAQLVEEGADDAGGRNATPCHTATVTSHELCYHNVVWAKHKGIHEHPQWYPGLKESSDFEAFQEVLRIDPKMGCPRPCKDFSVGAEDKTRKPTECHDTVLGERCFEHALWVMRVGIYQRPSWYPALNNESSFAAFQAHLHGGGKGSCPAPCEHADA